MTTTQTKTINFKIEDNARVNQKMGQRGTLFVEVVLNFINSDILDTAEYDGDYTMRWSSSFSEERTHLLSSGLHSEMVELLLESRYNEIDAFALIENHEYDFTYFEKYDIPYMISHDCARVESLIEIAAKTIVEFGITNEALDGDDTSRLTARLKKSFDRHEGNTVVTGVTHDQNKERKMYMALVLCHNEIHHCEPFGSLLEAEDRAVQLGNEYYCKDGIEAFGKYQLESFDEIQEYYRSDVYLDSGDAVHICIKKTTVGNHFFESLNRSRANVTLY